jgi:hypothetical protein
LLLPALAAWLYVVQKKQHRRNHFAVEMDNYHTVNTCSVFSKFFCHGLPDKTISAFG